MVPKGCGRERVHSSRELTALEAFLVNPVAMCVARYSWYLVGRDQGCQVWTLPKTEELSYPNCEENQFKNTRI